MSGTLWSDYATRFGLYRGIVAAKTSGLTDRVGRRTPYAILMAREGDAILRADRTFFEAARAVILAEREAIAASFEQAGQADLATLVRGRPTIDEWRKP